MLSVYSEFWGSDFSLSGGRKDLDEKEKRREGGEKGR